MRGRDGEGESGGQFPNAARGTSAPWGLRRAASIARAYLKAPKRVMFVTLAPRRPGSFARAPRGCAARVARVPPLGDEDFFEERPADHNSIGAQLAEVLEG